MDKKNYVHLNGGVVWARYYASHHYMHQSKPP